MEYNFDHILVRYGELSLKGKNRKLFIKRLHKNIKEALSDFENLTYKVLFDRFFINLNGEDVDKIIPILKQVHGLISFSPALKLETDPDKIVDAAYSLVENDIEAKTFKIIPKRKDKNLPFRSDDIIEKLARKILENTSLKVDVRNFDLGIMIEMNTNDTYIMAKVYQGAGGYPTGISGKAMLLLSGGIDSPVAGNLIQKRGMYLEAIHFVSPPYTSEESLDKTIRLGKKISLNQKDLRVFVVPFTKLQLAIHEHVDESYEITIMRRMMFRIAEGLAKKYKCKALVTGESLGQVSSQTIESISVINEVVKLPVLRPLISMDKYEIIKHARHLDTYKTSIEPYEDACTIFNPKNPITKPRLRECQMYESFFDYQSLVDECVENTEIKIVRFKDEDSEKIQLF